MHQIKRSPILAIASMFPTCTAMSVQLKVFVWVFVLIFAQGCKEPATSPTQPMSPPQLQSPVVSPQLLTDLKHGMSQSEVKEMLGARGHHQFTAAISNSTYRCVTYYPKGVHGRLYLLFRDDQLVQVSLPPPFQMRRIRVDGSWVNYGVLDDPETRVEAVLESDSLNGSHLKDLLTPREVSNAQPAVAPGLSVAFRLAHLLSDKSEISRRKGLISQELKRYDPYEIELGTILPDVEQKLGEPRLVEKLDPRRELRVYGNPEFDRREFLWISILYEENRVTRVFSHDFINGYKIGLLEQQWSSRQQPATQR